MQQMYHGCPPWRQGRRKQQQQQYPPLPSPQQQAEGKEEEDERAPPHGRREDLKGIRYRSHGSEMRWDPGCPPELKSLIMMCLRDNAQVRAVSCCLIHLGLAYPKGPF
jgi:hypothetical protein